MVLVGNNFVHDFRAHRSLSLPRVTHRLLHVGKVELGHHPVTVSYRLAKLSLGTIHHFVLTYRLAKLSLGTSHCPVTGQRPEERLLYCCQRFTQEVWWWS